MIIRNFLTTPPTLEASHEGQGTIKNVSLYGADDFSTDLRFVIYSELKPGTSIGYHTHGDNEEVYVILEGRGVMTVNGQAREVGAGDVILNKPHWSHGLENSSETDLKILVFEVQAR
jgi:mannose-6-phosphate isomerase-like protein (cupin superfamily)